MFLQKSQICPSRRNLQLAPIVPVLLVELGGKALRVICPSRRNLQLAPTVPVLLLELGEKALRVIPNLK